MAVEFTNLQNGLSTTLGNELNTRFNALKNAINDTETSLSLALDLNAALGTFTGPSTAYVAAVSNNNVTKWEDQGPRLNHALKLATVPEADTPIASAENNLAHVESNHHTHGLMLSQTLPFGPKTFYVVIKETNNSYILEWGYAGFSAGNFAILSNSINGYLREFPNPERTLPKSQNLNTWKILCVVIAETFTGRVSSSEAWLATPYQLGYGTNSYPAIFARGFGDTMNGGAQSRIRRLKCYAGAHSRLTRNTIITDLSTQYNIPIEIQL